LYETAILKTKVMYIKDIGKAKEWLLWEWWNL